MGLAPALFPQTTGCFSIQLREQMVGSAGNAPVRHFQFYFRDTGFTDRQLDRLAQVQSAEQTEARATPKSRLRGLRVFSESLHSAKWQAVQVLPLLS